MSNRFNYSLSLYCLSNHKYIPTIGISTNTMKVFSLELQYNRKRKFNPFICIRINFAKNIFNSSHESNYLNFKLNTDSIIHFPMNTFRVNHMVRTTIANFCDSLDPLDQAINKMVKWSIRMEFIIIWTKPLQTKSELLHILGYKW